MKRGEAKAFSVNNEKYGKMLLLDLHGCDNSLFSREALTRFFVELCDLIQMKRALLYFWGDEDDWSREERAKAPPHLAGISAVQFIETSSVGIHALDKLGKVFVDIFSCKDFDVDDVAAFSAQYFRGRVANHAVVDRI